MYTLVSMMWVGSPPELNGLFVGTCCCSLDGADGCHLSGGQTSQRKHDLCVCRQHDSLLVSLPDRPALNHTGEWNLCLYTFSLANTFFALSFSLSWRHVFESLSAKFFPPALTVPQLLHSLSFSHPYSPPPPCLSGCLPVSDWGSAPKGMPSSFPWT